MRLVLAAILVACVGCSVATPIEEVRHLLPPNQQRAPHHESIDSVLKYYLTPEAYEAVKDIPAQDGITFGGSYVPGVNIWASLVSIFTGSGAGRSVVFSLRGLENNGIYTIIHEYVHHLDDLTRDGEADFIDVDEFEVAWKRYEKEYPNHYKYIQSWADKDLTNIFGIGEYSEQIAYAVEHMMLFGGPPYMTKVFRKIIKGWNQ